MRWDYYFYEVVIEDLPSEVAFEGKLKEEGREVHISREEHFRQGK